MKFLLSFASVSSIIAVTMAGCNPAIADTNGSSTTSHLRRMNNDNNNDNNNNNDVFDRELMPTFPSYTQQCRDDAGPPFSDDVETFGEGGKYHDGKPATAIGDCPDALKGACESKPKTAAFLEGPVDCGGDGWFCRIIEEPGWPANNLIADLNFGYCNTQEGFDDPGYDRSGHCHGSDSDGAFYWWVRDHWFRGYNGKLRCCCGWNSVVTEGSIVNRCDYRRLVTRDENINECRDANEEGVTPYDGGCDTSDNAPFTIGQPIDEDNSKCWEVSNFGEPCDDDCAENNEVEDDNEEDEEDNESNDQGSGDEESQDNENEIEEEEEKEEEEGFDDKESQDNDNDSDDEEEEEEEEGSGDEESQDNDEEEEEEEGSEDEESQDNDEEEDKEEGSEDEESQDKEIENDEEEEDTDETCKDGPDFVFKERKKGKDIMKSCDDIADKVNGMKKKKRKKFCKKKKTSKGEKIGELCPKTCGKC